jgi:hypothetical protein
MLVALRVCPSRVYPSKNIQNFTFFSHVERKGKGAGNRYEILGLSPAFHKPHLELFNDSEPEVTPEYLESLLTEARNKARAAKQLQQQLEDTQEDDILALPAEPAKMYWLPIVSNEFRLMFLCQTSAGPRRPSSAVLYARKTSR